MRTVAERESRQGRPEATPALTRRVPRSFAKARVGRDADVSEVEEPASASRQEDLRQGPCVAKARAQPITMFQLMRSLGGRSIAVPP